MFNNLLTHFYSFIYKLFIIRNRLALALRAGVQNLRKREIPGKAEMTALAGRTARAGMTALAGRTAKTGMTTIGLALFLSFYSSWSFGMVAGNACLHPLEEAALFYGNQKEDIGSQIKKAEKQIEALEEKIDDLIEGKGRMVGISEWIDRLSNSIDEKDIYDRFESTDDEIGEEAVANLISDYMQSKQDKLDIEYKDKEEKLPWDSKRYFKSNGRVDDKFCEDFATGNPSECKKALKYLSRGWEKVNRITNEIEKLEELLEELDEEAFEREFGEGSTEGDGLCFECLDEIRALSRPTPGQTAGNVLGLIAGVGLSYYGYRAGKSSVRDSNNLRIQQGYSPLSTAGPAWAGASLGLPFIANGIYGLANGNSQIGNYACAPGAFSGGGYYGGGYGGMGGGYGGYGGFGGGMMGPGFNLGGGFGGGFGGGLGMMGPNYGMMGPGFHLGGGFGGGMMGPGFNLGGGFNFGPNYGMMGPGFNLGGGFNFGPNYGMMGPGFSLGGGFGGGMMGPGFNLGGGFGGGMMGPGFNLGGGYGGGMMGPAYQAQLLQQQQQQQQYAQYLEFQQQQMQARLEAQQAWMQKQQAIQQDRMQRQQVISSLNQEIVKIQNQIQMVAYGGVSAGLTGGSTTLSSSLTLGAQAPQQQTPAPSASPNQNSGDVPYIDSR